MCAIAQLHDKIQPPVGEVGLYLGRVHVIKHAARQIEDSSRVGVTIGARPLA